MNKALTPEELSRITYLEDTIKSMRKELNKLKAKDRINKDCNNKKERYANDPEFRKDRIEKSKLYYHNKIKPIIKASKIKIIDETTTNKDINEVEIFNHAYE
jgi:hypothetical protein